MNGGLGSLWEYTTAVDETSAHWLELDFTMWGWLQTGGSNQETWRAIPPKQGESFCGRLIP
jgi:hypothetical protein